MNVDVAAIIVTRGDQWPTMRERVLPSLPEDWEVLVWDNAQEDDLSVYGRYAAIERTDAELIYVQDDDVIVSDPDAIVERFCEDVLERAWYPEEMCVVCNMPPEFRHDFYEDHALVGFGAAFHRDAPQRAFRQWDHIPIGSEGLSADTAFFHRTCDIVFTVLTPRVLVDVPIEHLPYAYHYDRLWRQPEHQAERARMRELVLKVRDAS